MQPRPSALSEGGPKQACISYVGMKDRCIVPWHMGVACRETTSHVGLVLALTLEDHFPGSQLTMFPFWLFCSGRRAGALKGSRCLVPGMIKLVTCMSAATVRIPLNYTTSLLCQRRITCDCLQCYHPNAIPADLGTIVIKLSCMLSTLRKNFDFTCSRGSLLYGKILE